jgi:hypothetical protein
MPEKKDKNARKNSDSRKRTAGVNKKNNKSRNEKDLAEGEKEKNPCQALTLYKKKRNPNAPVKLSPLRKRFLRNYETCYGNVSAACSLTGIARQTFYRWQKSNTKVNKIFREKLALIRPKDLLLDVAEATLVKSAETGNLMAAMYILNKKGHERGYIDQNALNRQQLTELDQIKLAIEQQAQEKGCTFNHELQFYLKHLSSQIPPQLAVELRRLLPETSE